MAGNDPEYIRKNISTTRDTVAQMERIKRQVAGIASDSGAIRWAVDLAVKTLPPEGGEAPRKARRKAT